MINLMKNFSNERGNDYFRDYAIKQIKIASRIMDYLACDPYYKPKLNDVVMKMFINNQVEEAVEQIMYELSVDFGCSHGYDGFKKEAINLANELRIKYFEDCKNEKINKRELLLKEIEKIDQELKY